MNLISKEYKQMIAKIHSKMKWGREAGRLGGIHATIEKCLAENNLDVVLDYGSGWGGLKSVIDRKYKVIEYEPGIEEKSKLPEPHNFVACIDVLEHVEPELINNVLDDLKRVVSFRGLFTIACIESQRMLPNYGDNSFSGKNAHLIVKPNTWWLKELEKRFNVIDSSYNKDKGQLQVYVEYKEK